MGKTQYISFTMSLFYLFVARVVLTSWELRLGSEVKLFGKDSLSIPAHKLSIQAMPHSTFLSIHKTTFYSIRSPYISLSPFPSLPPPPPPIHLRIKHPPHHLTPCPRHNRPTHTLGPRRHRFETRRRTAAAAANGKLCPVGAAQHGAGGGAGARGARGA